MDDKITIGLVVQARMGSSRLPGKVLLPLPKNGKTTVIGHIIERCGSKEHEKFFEKIVIASSLNKENDQLEEFLNKNYPYVHCYRGDEKDVLSRFVDIQKEFKFDYVVRLTADNPCIDRSLIENAINELVFNDQLDYLHTEDFPLGMNIEVFKGKLLENLEYSMLTEEEKEHVTLKFKFGDYKVLKISAEPEIAFHAKNMRLTLDEELDYETLSGIFKEFNNNAFLLQNLIDKHIEAPSLFDLNKKVNQKKGYSFPNRYKVLNNQSIEITPYKIVPIRFEDRFKIMKWRNEQMYHLRQSETLTPNAQEKYFDEVVKHLFQQDRPNQILFSFLEGNKCIGYGGLVHINWIDRNAEISFIMDTVLEDIYFEDHWRTYLKLVEHIALFELNLHKIFTYAFDLRPKLYRALENQGYQLGARLKQHCFFGGKFLDVVIHSKILNQPLRLRQVTPDDIWLLYNWSNEEESRANSFSTGPISKEEHIKWFNRKVNNKQSLMLIGMLIDQPVGLVRYEIENEKSIVGINLDKNFRGKGLAVKLLKESLDFYCKTENVPVEAYIKNDNKASIKAFEKVGYRFLRNDEFNGIKSVVYYYEK